MRKNSKLLQDAILERLGVGAEDYEHLVNFNEYERWKGRQGILHNITFEKMERAESLLDEYYARYGKRDSENYSSIEEKLERQFYLSMLAQIRRYNGASGEELCMIFDEAIYLTVPALGHKPMSELILSIKELNLILEAEQYRKEGEQIARYREITEYIERAGLDERGMAKIYPKAVFFLCRSLIAADGKERPACCDLLHKLPVWELEPGLDDQGTKGHTQRFCHVTRIAWEQTGIFYFKQMPSGSSGCQDSYAVPWAG